MLVLAFVVFLFALTHQEDLYHVNPNFAKKIESFSAECTEESGVDPHLIEDLLNAKFINTPDLRCFLKCVFRNTGAMDENGLLIEEGVKGLMPTDVDKHKINIIFQKCGQFQVSDPCRTAFGVAKCSFEYVQ